MASIINIVQVVLAVILMAAILVQQQGTSLGGAFGGEGNVYRTRRGVEKFLFQATVAVAVIFIGLAIFRLIYKV